MASLAINRRVITALEVVDAVFTAKPFTAVNPSYCTDAGSVHPEIGRLAIFGWTPGKTRAGFPAAFLITVVYQVWACRGFERAFSASWV
jgi:hypothetical protein